MKKVRREMLQPNFSSNGHYPTTFSEIEHKMEIYRNQFHSQNVEYDVFATGSLGS
jgi:hypothetical protein